MIRKTLAIGPDGELRLLLLLKLAKWLKTGNAHLDWAKITYRLNALETAFLTGLTT